MLNIVRLCPVLFLWTTVAFISFFNVEVVCAQEFTDAEQLSLKIGIYDNAPIVFLDRKGNPRGFEVDLLNEIAIQEGWSLEYVYDEWAVLLEKARKGEIDLVTAIVYTEERDKFLDYAEVHFFSTWGVVSALRESNIQEVSVLDDKTVAVLAKDNIAETFKRLCRRAKIQPIYREVNTNREVFELIDSRKVFAGVTSNIRASNLEKYFNAKKTSIEFDPKLSMIAFPQGRHKEVSKTIDSYLRQWKSDKSSIYYSAYDRWFMGKGLIELAAKEDIKLSRTEQAWIKKKHTVRVRVANYPPYVIVQENHPPEGISIDYLKEVSKRVGITFDYVATNQSFAEFLQSMKANQGPDLGTSIVRSPEREASLSFSQGYSESPLVIFARSTAEFISDITGLTGKKVAVTKGANVHRLMVENYPEINLALFDSPKLGLEALATGQVDAYIGSLTASSHIIHRRGLADLHVVAPTPFDNYVFSMANRKDWPELTSIINKVLTDMSADEHSAIQGKYMQLPLATGPNTAQIIKWALIVVVPALFIVLMFVFWNRSMAKEVANRKLAEVAARQAQNAAEAATLAKSTFLANMSHELRTPMNAILGFARQLSRDKELAPEQREKVGIIDRSGEHLLGMVDDILSLAKIESGRIELVQEPFDVVQTLKDIGQMITSRAGTKGLRFDLELDANLAPYLQGDVGKIRQILINLLGNAIKFTSDGNICLRARSQPMADDPARVMLQLEVEDSGLGIPQEQLDKIFDSFAQGDSAGDSAGGVGLGLAISKSLVDMMAGEIDVKSEPGKGSVFTVTIPLALADAKALMAQPAPEAQVIGLKPGQADWRILVVDDNRDNRALLISILGPVGFVTREAENGETAIEAFKQWHPHLILMDMRMPVMDGYTATGKIRELPGGDEVKIVAVTAQAFDEHREEILAAGCDDLVHKPFREHEIFDAMARHLGVEYLYDEVTETPVPEETMPLTAEMLIELPEELLSGLREATLILDRDTIFAIIERIEPQALDTARALQELVDDFQIGQIQDLLESIE